MLATTAPMQLQGNTGQSVHCTLLALMDGVSRVQHIEIMAGRHSKSTQNEVIIQMPRLRPVALSGSPAIYFFSKTDKEIVNILS